MSQTTPAFDPVMLAVLSNRMDAIVREMTNTLLRAARSAVIAMSRDFSCCIVTGDGRLLATAEAAPVHVFGTHLQAQAMSSLHPDVAEGDAFLHNDPYLGNTHPADHTLLVPVFFEGEHLFTAVAKAHQADIGNSIPTTYHAAARDIYEEGALIFPCVRIQRDYQNCEDIIRMCRRRIRVPDQWYGDYLAAIGAARIGERRLKALAAQYGAASLKDFITAWFDYSERRIVQEIKRLPAGRLENTTCHDPIPGVVPNGIPLKVALSIDPEAAMIDIDLRDNPDCLPCGLNESEACAINNVMTGVFNCLDPDIPHNAGTFRRIRVHLRENCVVGIPRFPTSCSVATTNVGDRLVNATQSAFAGIGEGWGLAEGNTALTTGCAVVSGRDARHAERDFINQMFLMGGGGPASPQSDGWINLLIPVGAGLLYRDSVELDEQKYPLLVKSLRLMPDSGGPGRQRGAPGTEVVYGPRARPLRVVSAPDGWRTPPRGVRGGCDGTVSQDHVLHADGRETKVEGFVNVELAPGEFIRGRDCGGGGYGDPLERDPDRVLHDVRERWVSRQQAEDVYGVVFAAGAGLAIDAPATREKRVRLAAARLRAVPPVFYNPLDGKPERMQIGARVLELAQWIEVDAHYAQDLAQKRRLLGEQPAQVLASLPQGLAGSREVLALLGDHLPRYFPALTPPVEPADESLHPIAQAALRVQEDLCVMSPLNGEWVLTAAAVCFPNRWDLTGKIGRSLMGIHQPVPHYAEKIGAATDSLFHKLTVDRPLWRLNWTIVDSPALHQPVPVPVPDALRLVNEDLAENLWFRRERQTLRKLPESGDILFTIRTYVHSLAETQRRVPDFRAQLAASMTGLDQAMVDYKGWAGIREALGRWARS